MGAHDIGGGRDTAMILLVYPTYEREPFIPTTQASRKESVRDKVCKDELVLREKKSRALTVHICLIANRKAL